MNLKHSAHDTIGRRPVMVFAGSFWTGSSESGLSAGFRDLGWAVQEVDQRDFGVRPSGDLLFRVAARVSRRRSAEAYRRKLLEECRALKPDIFLTVKGQDISADLLLRIKEIGAQTVMYYPDVDFNHAGVSVDSFREFDLFISTKSFQIGHLEKLLGRDRVAHVPHGYCPSVHRPFNRVMTESSFTTDILHAGNHSAYKQKWLESATSAVPEAAFRLVGNRWREHAGHGPLANCDMPGARMGVGYAQAIQTARVNVAVHMGATSSGWQDWVSTRTFEIPACGGFMLHIDNDEVREYFKPGEEIDVFSSPEELADKIRFYLPRPELRTTMVDRALARCCPTYSYNARARQVAELIQHHTEGAVA